MELKVGTVTHYFSKMGAATVKITEGTLKVGDLVHIKGSTTDFQQTVESIRLYADPVEEAKEGQEIGVKVMEKVRENDVVYKVVD